MVDVQAIPPDVRLKDYVETYYYSEGENFPTDIYLNVPTLIRSGLIFHIDGGANTMVDDEESIIPKTCIKGPFDKAYFLKFTEPKVSVVIVQFSITGLYELTGIDLSTIKNTYPNMYDFFNKKLLDDLNDQLLKAKGSAERIGVVSNFLLELIENRQIKETDNKTFIVKNALKIAEERDFQISLAEVCDELAVSSKTLERSFKQVTGITPKQYISGTLFMGLMQELLQDKDKLISEVANSPFYDFPHINKWFTRYSNMSPSIFNKREHYALETILKNQGKAT